MPQKLVTSFEKSFRDSIAEESLDLYGTTVTLHSLVQLPSIGVDSVSILYGETGVEGWDFTSYYNVKVFILKADTDMTTTEGGLSKSKTSTASFARGYLDRLGIPYPKEGDVIEHPSFGFFDILKATKDGHYTDEDNFHTVFECEIERTDRYHPSLRVNP